MRQSSWQATVEQEDEMVSSDSSWVVTYLDTFTLLLGFFVILTGLGDYKFFTIFDETSKSGTWVNADLMAVHSELQQRYEPELRSGQVEVRFEDFEIRLSFIGNSFFDSGRAELLPEGRSIINRSLEVFKDIGPNRFHIDVEGHTDSRPIQSASYPSNWELSAARAAAVVKGFIEMRYPSTRIKASGYADSAPIVPETDAVGNPDPDLMALNRRIVFRIYVKSR